MPDNPEELAYEGMDIYRDIKERKLREEQEEKEAIEKDKNRPFELEEEVEEASNNQLNTVG